MFKDREREIKREIDRGRGRDKRSIKREIDRYKERNKRSDRQIEGRK
jgi:hypothetical protein